MKTLYRTKVPTEIKQAIRWVTKQFQSNTRPVVISVEKSLFPKAFSEGLCEQFSDRFAVTLHLSPGRSYPVQNTYKVTGLPNIKIGSFLEEVVLVLAHELRHVQQMDLGKFSRMSEFSREYDAEVWGREILEQYRHSIR